MKQRKALLACTAALGLQTAAAAERFPQPYPCNVQPAPTSDDCKAFIGEEVNGCVKVDGVFTNTTAKPVETIIVTAMINKRVVTNLTARVLTNSVAPGGSAPYSGATKLEFTQAVLFRNALYDATATSECLLSPAP